MRCVRVALVRQPCCAADGGGMSGSQEVIQQKKAAWNFHDNYIPDSTLVILHPGNETVSLINYRLVSLALSVAACQCFKESLWHVH